MIWSKLTGDDVSQKPGQIIVENPAEEGEELSEIRRNAGAGWEQASQPVPGRDLLLEKGTIVEKGGVIEPVFIGVDAEEPLHAVAGRLLSHGCGTGASCGRQSSSDVSACWEKGPRMGGQLYMCSMQGLGTPGDAFNSLSQSCEGYWYGVLLPPLPRLLILPQSCG
jgi:hypothetical protein